MGSCFSSYIDLLLHIYGRAGIAITKMVALSKKETRPIRMILWGFVMASVLYALGHLLGGIAGILQVMA